MPKDNADKSAEADRIYMETMAKLNTLKDKKRDVILGLNKKIDAKKIDKARSNIEGL